MNATRAPATERKGSQSFPRTFAILLASEAIGGEERYLVELATAMQASSTEPVVLNLKNRMPYRTQLADRHVSVHTGIAHHRFSPLGPYRLYRLLRRIRPDALLINSNRQALWLGTLLARLCQVPVILIHTHDHLGRSRVSLRVTSRWADGVIAAARQHRERLCHDVGLSPVRVIPVHPGIDLDRVRSPGKHRPARTDARRIGVIAALRPEKDHETFLRALALVSRQVPGIEAWIVGDGSRRPALESLSRELGIEGVTRFLGWREIDGHLLRRLDLLALSSVSETFPAVMLEAFAAGIPVVATDVGAIGELAGSPPCAVLVKPGDPGALRDGLRRVLDNPDLAAELSRCARERVERFSADRFCRNILEVARRTRYGELDRGAELLLAGDPS